MEWMQTGAAVIVALKAAELTVKLFRHARAALKGTASPGVTIKNGEYRKLVADIGEIKGALPALTRIENRVEQVAAEMNSRMDAHGKRLESVEHRLAT